MSCFFCAIYAIFKVEISAEYKIRDGKVGMVKEIMEGTIDMEIFRKFGVKTFIPVKRRAVHTSDGVKRHVYIAWQYQ